MEELIKNELFKNVDSFINEIDLTMDYLDKSIISDIKKYINKIKNESDEFKLFIQYINEHICQFEAQISAILFSNKKIKSSYYDFVDNIILFNNLLHFKVFNNESKNTKKSMIKYIYTIYMSCVFLSLEHNNSDILSDKLSNFISKIQQEATNSLKEQDIKQDRSSRNTVRNTPSNADGLNDINNLMNSILGNNEILNIATDISNKMKTQNLNPMSMLTNLMSGNIENSPLQHLVEEIQQKVEDKINNGTINKETLENQAQTLMNSIGSNTNIINSMPGMSDLIQNMVKDINQTK